MTREIVPYERGITKKVYSKVPSDVESILTLVRLDDIALSLDDINAYNKKQTFQGKNDPWRLSANDQVQHLDTINTHPDAPWISCFIINRGPNKVRIQVNESTQRWLIMGKGETRTIYYSKAEERISYINYQCDPGETAVIEVEGVY